MEIDGPDTPTYVGITCHMTECQDCDVFHRDEDFDVHTLLCAMDFQDGAWSLD